MLTLKTEIWRMPVGIGYEPSPVGPEWLARLIASHPANANGQIADERPACAASRIDYRRAMRLAVRAEIAGNVGAVMRLGACLGVPVDLIEPMGFKWDDRRVRGGLRWTISTMSGDAA